MLKQISLLIDGKAVTVPENTLLVDAAKRAGIDIPVFCYHPKMQPVGMCRVCLVEVGRPMIDRATGKVVMDSDGSPKIQFGPKLETACTTPVADGMIVHANSERAKAARNEILEFLLTSHPLDCPVCDKGGECPLQNLTLRYGPAMSRFKLEEKIHLDKHVALGELILLDRERCIQCGRCVRYQSEVVDDPVIGFYQRGRAIQIISCSEPGFDSIFSGNTTDICPVGALTSVDFRFGARPWEMKSRESLCTHCPVGCNLAIDIRRDAKSGGDVIVKRIMPRQNETVNGIWICDKGRFVHHFANPKSRILKPLIRKTGKLVPVSLDSALDQIAGRLRKKDARLVTLVGGRLANEDLFNIKQLTEKAHGKLYLYSGMAGGEHTLYAGLSQGTSLDDLKQGNVILVVASDLHEEAPIYWLKVKQAVSRGAKLIVVGARETRLDKHAQHIIRYRYGEEALTLEQLINTKMKYAPVFHEIQKAQGLVIFVGNDGLSVKDSQAVLASAAQLLFKTGFSGKPGSGLIGVWPSANTQGAWELGYMVAADIETAIRKADVLIVAGADPAGDFPWIEKVLGSVSYLVVLELALTATAELADAVIPVQAFTERGGTLTTAERRVQAYYPAVNARPGVFPDYAIAAMLGGRLGIKLSNSLEEIFTQISGAASSFKGLSFEHLGAQTGQWPPVGGTNKYFSGTAVANTKGQGISLPLLPNSGKSRPGPAGQAGYEKKKLWAVPVTRLYDYGNTVKPSRILEKRMIQFELHIHPDTAESIDIREGSVIVSLGNGNQPAKCIFDATVPTGFILIPRSAGIPIREVTQVKLSMASDKN